MKNKSNQLTNGPSLKTARDCHACGELQVDGKSYIIVSGGYRGYGTNGKWTEILDKTNPGQGWQKGENIKILSLYSF